MLSQLGKPRAREETLETVTEIETLARSYGNLEAIKSLKTSTGVKDTSLQFFIDKIEHAMRGKRAKAARKVAFDQAMTNLPQADLRSAIFKLRGSYEYLLACNLCLPH